MMWLMIRCALLVLGVTTHGDALEVPSDRIPESQLDAIITAPEPMTGGPP